MQVYFVHIYCKKKLMFPIVTSVIEEIKPVQLMCLASQILNSNIHKHLLIAEFKCN